MARILRAVVLAAVAAAALVMNAAPAWAHGVSGLQPTDYRTTVRGVVPPIPGVRVRAVDLGGKLELTNSTPVDVVIRGYQNEPYLRVGPRGVFENTWSPAVLLNRTTTPTGAPPAPVDPNAAPTWRQISTASKVAWHDHRAHWMGSSPPPEVTSDSSHRHVVIAGWQVPMTYGSMQANATGDVVWIPPPSPLPWTLGAVGIAASVTVASRTRRWPIALAVALALLVGAEAAHIAGLWGASTASTVSKTGSSLYSLAGCIVGLGALALIRRRDPYDATPVVLISAVFLFIAGGLADVTTLSRSQIPSTLPAGVARTLVMAALGLGLGLVVASGWRLRRPQTVQPDARTRTASRGGRSNVPGELHVPSTQRR